MVRPLVVLLATALLAACTPLGGSPGASPTPQAATPLVSAGPAARPVATAEGCTAAHAADARNGAVFVALADRGDSGVAFVLDPSTGAIRGQVDISGTPEGAVDWSGNRLLLFCTVAGTARLVAYDLSSLREQWQIPVEGRSITKAPGGLPALAVGNDGRFVFVLHYKTLRPGDAYAPGASITWLTGHDAPTGAEHGRVDFPDCVAARIFVASDGVPYVMCRDHLYAISTSTWSVVRTFPFSGSVGPVGIVGDRTVYGVTQGLRLVAMDLKTGETSRMDKSGGTGATAQAWGRLTAAPSGSTVWVIAKATGNRAEYDPDTLAVLNLNVSTVVETRIPGLRGVGLVGTRVVYGAGGALRSTDGTIDEALIDGRVEYWHIFGAPNSAS